MIGVNHYYGEYKGHYIGKVEHTPPKRNHNYYEFVYPENIYIPKEYKDTRLMFDKKDSYDIALLRLKTKAVGIPTLSISDVSVDELVARYPLLNPVPIIVIGVGRNEQEYLSKDLMKAPLRVNHYDGQPKSIIYLSSPRIPEQNICSGDSGGPAIFENTDGKNMSLESRRGLLSRISKLLYIHIISLGMDYRYNRNTTQFGARNKGLNYTSHTNAPEHNMLVTNGCKRM